MTMTTDALMTVSGIGKAFGDQQVLAEVSFEVASSEILGLIGPNGAGKTTLLECIAGLLPTDVGTFIGPQTGPLRSRQGSRGLVSAALSRRAVSNPSARIT